MVRNYVGNGLQRREDASLITGQARYTNDISAPNQAYISILRSQYGHAKLTDVDTTAAEAVDGVVAAFNGADLATSDSPAIIHKPAAVENGVETDFPIVAVDRVRFIGEAVAVVVAEDPYIAHDALELIEVEYERLDAVIDPREALADGAPTVHDHAPDNVAFDWTFGDANGTNEAFSEAAHKASIEVRNQRVIGNPIEPRVVLAEPDDGGLSITMSTQVPHQSRDHIADVLGFDPSEVRVVAPDVGGGFGIKGGDHPDEAITAWCALHLDRPVKWTATRTEGHRADYQSRDWYFKGSLAMDESARILGLRFTAHHTVGAYYVFPPSLSGNVEILASGQYQIPAIHGHIVGSFTNTTPVAPYRGAGRPEVMHFLERLIDTGARELGWDPAEFRRVNQIPSDAFPYETAVGSVYDSGDYERALDLALEHVDYNTLRERQARLREEGRYLGIGLSCFVENSGSSPGMGETGRVRLDEDGTVIATLGTHDHGQGHGTTFAQLLADTLGIEYDHVEIREGDTSQLDEGVGTFGSRSVALGGGAAFRAAEAVIDEARQHVADSLEVATGDLEFEDGTFRVSGVPSRSMKLTEVAADVGKLEATHYYDPPNYGFSFGTHIAVVEVDPEIGEIDIDRYVAVDDCGEVINPKLVEGQIHGGVAQGIGQAFFEGVEYDDSGTLLTGSLQDYTLPKAFHIPEIETEETVTPSPHNPIGAKGTGESGTIAATPAVANAVMDALRPFGIENIDLPITQEAVWRAISESGN